MEAFKNGVKTTLRTPGKSLLFSLILLLLALLAAVAFSVFFAVRGYLSDCEDYFHTIVHLEYIGKDYPEDTVYDGALQRAITEHQTELDALCRSEQVLEFSPATNAAALMEGLHRKDLHCYDPDAAVLQVFVTGWDELSHNYIADVQAVLYSREDVTGKMLLMNCDDRGNPDAPQPEKWSSCLVCGHFYLGNNNLLCFKAESLSYRDSGETVQVPSVTQWKEKQVPADHPYARLAAHLEQANNSCPVRYSAAPEDLLPFHQQILTIREGRLYTEQEAAEKAKVCVISSSLAALGGFSCGASVPLSVLEADADLYSVHHTFPEAEDYLIVGICTDSKEQPYRIYLPAPAQADASVSMVNGYDLGQFRIRNSGATAFLEQAQALEQYGFHCTVYDQGYAAAVEPMQELILLSALFLMVCVVLTVAVLCLQCHLFITRQREAAQTMLTLGSGKAHVRGYFLSGSMLLGILTVPLGCLGGRLLEGWVMRQLVRLTATQGVRDLRFSSSRLTLIRTLEFAPKIPLWVYLAAGAFLFLCAVCLTLLFSTAALRDRAEKKRRKPKKPVTPKARRSSHLSGRLKYAILSIRRNTTRTAVVVALSVTVALFFGYLTDSLQSYRVQLEAVQNNTVLSGHATNSTGQLLDDLMVSKRIVCLLKESDCPIALNLSRKIGNLQFYGISETADGEARALEEPAYPEDGSFEMQRWIRDFYFEPQWKQTSSVSDSPLFYYTKPTALTWLEGYCEASMLEEEWDCVLPQSMMDAHGIVLGDTVRFIFLVNDEYVPVFDTIDLKVIGAYQSLTESQTVFSPIGHSRIHSERAMFNEIALTSSNYHSMVFTLKDAKQLDPLREALANAGFDYAHSGRNKRLYAVIDDEVYLNTVRSMERQINYVGTLYACLYAILFGLGFVLSYLMTVSRKKELALMRALGTQGTRIVANFHVEQTVLCGAGLLLGLLLWRMIGKPLATTQLLLTVVFFAIWSLTALFCVLKGMRKQAYNDLVEPE